MNDLFKQISKKMAKEMADYEDARVMQIIEEMACPFCKKHLADFSWPSYCCDNYMINHIVES